MSLILEALKKSEQQRRLGEVPTLGSPMLTSRPRRSMLPAFAVLIVIALGAGWWLLRTPATPAPTAPPHMAPAASATPVAEPAATPPRSGNDALASPAVADRQKRRERRPAVADNGAPLPISAAAADRPGSVATLPPANALTGGPRDVPATAAAPAPPRAAPPAAARSAPPAAGSAHAAAAPAPMAVQPPVAPPLPAHPPARAQTDLPTVWELPYATRKDLPNLHLTMHVYASDPAERFVVIAGERHVEGDDLGDGVTLSEIRPDGLVLSFKGKPFVYPRDGR